MWLSQPSSRTAAVIIVVVAAATCTMFSIVCLGQDAAVTALTAVAIFLSGVGIILLTYFISDTKRNPCARMIVNACRRTPERSAPDRPIPNRFIPDRPPIPPFLPSFVPPFPMPPPQIIAEDGTILIQPPGNPPSYEESAEIEDRRITENSNAPPAYNRTNYASDNNIASFSPPPYYSPVSPFFGTSVQTTTLYLSAENVASTPSPVPLRSPILVRAPSPVRRHPARKPRRSPRRPRDTIVVIDDQAGASTSTSTVPKTPTRTLPQMFIDCSKAEPTLFSINGGLWNN